MEQFVFALLYSFSFAPVLLLILVIAFIYFTTPEPNMTRFESEKTFIDPQKGGQRSPFPSLYDQPSLELSVIVPSYYEEKRLPKMMDEAIEVLESRQRKDKSQTYEIIVVDDGSKDGTSEVALEYSKRYGTNLIRVLTLEKNRGKGGAVRLGMLSARGRNLLFADADGATKFADIVNLEKSMTELREKDEMAIVCGSRAHLQDEAVATRSFFRTLLMYGFHFLVWFLCVRGIRDTQCGFKLLSREAARVVFPNMHVERWAFDVEMLYIAQSLGIAISEVAVNWEEIEGTKMIPFFSWAQMGRDLILIRLRYLFRFWKIDPKLKVE
ncbi:dolichyl-phosphate beta-glucosyltransferase-like [Diadema setosum]|uniref:dolichyl-phosphate beta-glucosyltransferase-like n=1 Tax=Diadema setosum TaxID=31175 RepID=UPI003B3ACCB8